MDELMGFEGNESEISSELISQLNSSLWVLAEDLNGPALAGVIIVEFILSFTFNSFIVVYSLLHFKENMKQSSTLLLFILALTNLLTSIFYTPFTIVTSISGEWIFGNTDYTRKIFCQIEGFILTYLFSASVDTLAVISIDRCLGIVRVDLHRKSKSWRISLSVIACLWVFSAIMCFSPFFAPGFGRYDWSQQVGSCLAKFIGYKNYVILQTIHAIILVSIIVFTSLWVFLFTRGFLKQRLKRQESVHSLKNFTIASKQRYAFQMKKVVGIFGALILLNFLSWIPFVIVSIVGVVVGFENMPSQLLCSTFVLFLFNNVSNPMIHIFFRKDMLDVFRKLCCKKKLVLKKSPSKHSLRWQISGVISTTKM